MREVISRKDRHGHAAMMISDSVNPKKKKKKISVQVGKTKGAS